MPGIYQIDSDDGLRKRNATSSCEEDEPMAISSTSLGLFHWREQSLSGGFFRLSQAKSIQYLGSRTGKATVIRPEKMLDTLPKLIYQYIADIYKKLISGCANKTNRTLAPRFPMPGICIHPTTAPTPIMLPLHANQAPVYALPLKMALSTSALPAY